MWVFVEAEDLAFASGDAVVPETMDRVGSPKLFSGMPIEPNQRRAGGAVEALGTETSGVALEYLVCEKRELVLLAIVGEPDATDQHIFVHADEAPLFRLVRVVLRDRNVQQVLAGRRIQHMARGAFHDVNAIGRGNKICPAGVRTGNVVLVVLRIKRRVFVGVVVVDVVGAQVFEFPFPQRAAGVDIACGQ